MDTKWFKQAMDEWVRQNNHANTGLIFMSLTNEEQSAILQRAQELKENDSHGN